MTEQLNSSRAPLYTILGMVGFVLVLGFIISPRTEEGKLRWITFLGTTNQGELLNPPIELTPEHLMAEDGSAWQTVHDNSNWVLAVLVPNNQCLEHCSARLAQLMSIKTRLNREGSRLEIATISTQALTLRPEFARVESTVMQAESFTTVFAARSFMSAENPVLLMDPHGVLMMSYTTKHTGTQMLDDIKHLFDLTD